MEAPSRFRTCWRYPFHLRRPGRQVLRKLGHFLRLCSSFPLNLHHDVLRNPPAVEAERAARCTIYGDATRIIEHSNVPTPRPELSTVFMAVRGGALGSEAGVGHLSAIGFVSLLLKFHSRLLAAVIPVISSGSLCILNFPPQTGIST